MRERANPFLRFVDRYLGIFLVCVLSFFKKKRQAPKKIKSVAFLKSAGIGDVILLSAVIQDLKSAFPKIQITLFSGISNYEGALFIENIAIKPLPMTRPFEALRQIRKNTFDIWIDCDPWPRITALFSFFSLSKFTVGFKTSGEWRHFLYDYPMPHSNECHELDNYRKFVRFLGVEPSGFPYFPVSSSMGNRCKVALHLFAGGSQAHLKEWPKERWKQLIRFLLHNNVEIVLTGSKKDEAKLKEFVISQNVVNLAGKCSLKETARILKTCACLISVDTGIMHLGSALDMPVISLHGPTSPKRWGGLGKKVISLTPDLKYTPCIQLGFESKCVGCTCMKSISFERVKNALLKILFNEGMNESVDFGWRQRNKALAAFQKEIS